MIRGTCHFVSKNAAIRYYLDYVGHNRAEATKLVEQKLRDKEIRIGRPPTKQNEVVYTKNDEGRFFINDMSALVKACG